MFLFAAQGFRNLGSFCWMLVFKLLTWLLSSDFSDVYEECVVLDECDLPMFDRQLDQKMLVFLS